MGLHVSGEQDLSPSVPIASSLPDQASAVNRYFLPFRETPLHAACIQQVPVFDLAAPASSSLRRECQLPNLHTGSAGRSGTCTRPVNVDDPLEFSQPVRRSRDPRIRKYTVVEASLLTCELPGISDIAWRGVLFDFE